MRLIRPVLLGVVSFLLPAMAMAHPGHGGTGLVDGFSHPLLGWDHLLAMLAVGVWAAQQRGRAAWAIPLAFVGVMSVGGIAGARHLAVPAVEPLIAASVLVFGVLIGVRARPAPALGAALAGFFAFFHGFAHGSEIPSSASLLSFGTGFVAATLLLHGAGWLLARILAGSLLFGSNALGQDSKDVEKIEVRGRADSLVGVADSATQGTVGFEQLDLRPMLRVGELLETVPGVIVTQHAGGGKANQYFLRGFNLDHGTDFATSVDGVPYNLPSHGHGQGYTDLNGIIPELVERVNFRKGPYYADVGDFSSAGAADMQLFDTLDKNLARLEGGNLGHYRAVTAGSGKLGPGNLLLGLEGALDDGPWKKPDDYRRGAGVVRYTQEVGDQKYGLTAMGYGGDWDSSDQIARSALAVVGRFGSLDDGTGGNSDRYGLCASWERNGDESGSRVVGYAFYYDLDLFSNFTYFLDDPVNGDQFEQTDRRWTSGLEASHSRADQLAGRDVSTTFGLQLRNDSIRNGLFHTRDRSRLGTTREDRIHQTSVAPYLETEIRWLDHFRSIAGLRADWYRFDVGDELGINSGARQDAIVSPKLTLVSGPWQEIEFYLQGGLGFHSNDARGVNDAGQPADPLVRTAGFEGGLRSTWLPGLQSTLSLWQLDIDSELVFAGDAGTTEPSRPSRRKGIEFANYYTPTEWLTLDLDVSLSHARFRDNSEPGHQIPGSIEQVVAAGISLHDVGPFSASLRLRYFGSRPLVETDEQRSSVTALVSARVGYQIDPTWSLDAELFNLLAREDSDIEYFYASRIRPTAPAEEQIHLHPVEPMSLRVGLTARF